MVEMIKLSVQISDIMNYEIKIAKEITADTFPEVMKRLKAINSMLPKEIIMREEKPIEKSPIFKDTQEDHIVEKVAVEKDKAQIRAEKKRFYAKKYYDEHRAEISAKASAKARMLKYG